MRILKQSTAAIVTLGPFVDATDGFSLEEGLTASANQVGLRKSGSTIAVDLAARSWTHRGQAVYSVSLTTTDTDTAGPALITASMTGARTVTHEFNVLAATAYDALVSGTQIPADVTKIGGNATAAVLATFTALGAKNFTVGSGSTTTRIATDLTESASSHWSGRSIVFISGNLAGQAASITSYNGSTKELTVGALTAAPTVGDIVVIV